MTDASSYSVPTFDFTTRVRCIRPEPWMGRARPIHRSVAPFAAGAWRAGHRDMAERQADGGAAAVSDSTTPNDTYLAAGSAIADAAT